MIERIASRPLLDARDSVSPTGKARTRRSTTRIRVDGKFFAKGDMTFRVRGVTYGPFPPDHAGQFFPSRSRVADDFARMNSCAINAIRTYHVPPEWLLELAAARGIDVLIDVPWPKHVCFLDSVAACAEARRAVEQAARRGRDHPSVLAYSIVNEIRPDVVRWHGVARVERFLAELRDVAKQTDPEGLVTYASYPPTEYLDASPFDFVTFNVYLHDREAFARYLLRLQNLAGEKPLVFGELGMDTLRHGELEQADFLQGHVRESLLLGSAGSFVFSWTDEWYTGGYLIEDWAFGVTRADRTPKPAFHALREVFEVPTSALLEATPRVSVVVCSYNGAATLDECLRSLRRLDYPDYEVILVDDGSTDETPEIADRFPEVRTIRQNNHGLSVARNVGLQAATGAIVAYTDSDCFADPEWLTLLVYQLERTGAAAVGGPNLTPEDGWLAACVAASPGQPTHVLENDQLAEHIPGCNMAFRREALDAINGFDPQYRKAGDDVDVCWRLQQAGSWITFAPGAFVWHHRRQTVRTYLKQQAGYGEAEALLRFKHPAKFNGRGDGKWRGVLYGNCHNGLRLERSLIYRGAFGNGFFQTLYQPGPAHWAMLPTTLEWHAAVVLAGLLAFAWPDTLVIAAAMLSLSALVAVLQGAQARLAARHDGMVSRCLVAALCYFQPLVRSWARYRTRILSRRSPIEEEGGDQAGPRMPLAGAATVEYWSEAWDERTALLDRVVAYLDGRGWGKALDSGWTDWDLLVACYRWSTLRVCTVQEDHGSGKRLIRVRYWLWPSEWFGPVGLLAAAAVLMTAAGPASWLATGIAAVTVATGFVLWMTAVRRAGRLMRVFDRLALEMGWLRCEPSAKAGPVPRRRRRVRSGSAA